MDDRHVKAVLNDLLTRRGEVQTRTHEADRQVVVARVPLSELFGFEVQLRAHPHERASCSIGFAGYQPDLVAVTWIFFAVQSMRVPLLTQRIVSMEQDARRLDTLQLARKARQRRGVAVSRVEGKNQGHGDNGKLISYKITA